MTLFICSDGLNLMPPAPLYLWTLWCYTNAVIIIILELNGRYFRIIILKSAALKANYIKWLKTHTV